MEEMHKWPTYSDEKVFGGAGEQPGSQGAYWRSLEIKRRHYLLAKETSQANVAAAMSSIDASKATVNTAYWTKLSAIAVLITAIIAGAALVFQIISLFD